MPTFEDKESMVKADEVADEEDEDNTVLGALRRAIESGIIYRVIMGVLYSSLAVLRHKLHSGNLLA